MTITTYAELKTAISDWTDDGSQASDFADTYIDLAESHYNRVLRLREMEEEATVTLTTGDGPLPADFLEMRWVKTTGSPVYTLSAVGINILEDKYETTSGYPGYYAITNGTLKVRPSTDTVDIGYYEQIPALSDGTTTNWLLDRAPLLYLHSCEKHHAWRRRDYEGYNLAKQAEMELIFDLNGEDERARWVNSTVRVRGHNP